MAEYPRVKPEGEISCGRRCEVVFYKTPGPVRPFVIACQSRKCGHKGFVRADSAAEAESLWINQLELVEA